MHEWTWVSEVAMIYLLPRLAPQRKNWELIISSWMNEKKPAPMEWPTSIRYRPIGFMMVERQTRSFTRARSSRHARTTNEVPENRRILTENAQSKFASSYRQVRTSEMIKWTNFLQVKGPGWPIIEDIENGIRDFETLQIEFPVINEVRFTWERFCLMNFAKRLLSSRIIPTYWISSPPLGNVLVTLFVYDNVQPLSQSKAIACPQGKCDDWRAFA